MAVVVAITLLSVVRSFSFILRLRPFVLSVVACSVLVVGCLLPRRLLVLGRGACEISREQRRDERAKKKRRQLGFNRAIVHQRLHHLGRADGDGARS